MLHTMFVVDLYSTRLMTAFMNSKFFETKQLTNLCSYKTFVVTRTPLKFVSAHNGSHYLAQIKGWARSFKMEANF